MDKTPCETPGIGKIDMDGNYIAMATMQDGTVTYRDGRFPDLLDWGQQLMNEKMASEFNIRVVE